MAQSSSQKSNRWPAGTYCLINARRKAAFDLSGSDYKSIIGWSLTGGTNQQWTFIPKGSRYIIRCERKHAGDTLYCSIEGNPRENVALVGLPSMHPTEWIVEQTSEGIRYCGRGGNAFEWNTWLTAQSRRISWPDSNLVATLVSDDTGDYYVHAFLLVAHMSFRAHTCSSVQVRLTPLIAGELYQLWHYTRCVTADPDLGRDGGVRMQDIPATHVAPQINPPSSPTQLGRGEAVSRPTTMESVIVTESEDFITTTRTTTTTVITTVTEVIRIPRSAAH